MPHSPTRRVFPLLVLAVALIVTACGARSGQRGGDSGVPVAIDSYRPLDSRSPRDAALLRDQGNDMLEPCGCKPGQVWLDGPCVPTLELGCGLPCDIDSMPGCGPDRICDGNAATSYCLSDDRRAACVPAATTGPLPGPLRISPTEGVAGEKQLLYVQGANFYVGALFYEVRMLRGAEVIDVEIDISAISCSLVVYGTFDRPGIYTVQVSEYGGGERGWVLAGFYTATAGSMPEETIQPGFRCGEGDVCGWGPGYSCGCVDGRCRCNL